MDIMKISVRIITFYKNKNSCRKYLGSGLIKGVGPKFAQRIVKKFGVESFTVIEDNIELLREVEGIGSIKKPGKSACLLIF